jgi:pyrroloquinoline quinone biosynthesis protein B
VPQWNCACQNCDATRAGFVPARTQSGVAVSSNGESWFLINASPDLGAQLNAFPALHPRPPHLRQSRIAGVLLTNGDLDHVLGLLSLREAPALAVHATAAVRETLGASGIEGLLTAFCAVTWHEPAGNLAELECADGTTSGLTARAIFLPGTPPPFLKKSAHATGHSVAYQIEDQKTGARLLVAPDVSAITPELSDALANSHIILINGGSLAPLRALPASHKAYFHINNTNPILAPGSPERAQVEAAGMIVGYDGLEFAL